MTTPPQDQEKPQQDAALPLPCPWCKGQDGVPVVFVFAIQSKGRSWTFQCGCGARSNRCVSRGEAIASWNRVVGAPAKLAIALSSLAECVGCFDASESDDEYPVLARAADILKANGGDPEFYGILLERSEQLRELARLAREYRNAMLYWGKQAGDASWRKLSEATTALDEFLTKMESTNLNEPKDVK